MTRLTAGSVATANPDGTQTTYHEALREAQRDALTRDPRVSLMSEDVGRYGGSFAVSLGLLEEFGPERIRDAPLSESAFTGAGIGRPGPDATDHRDHDRELQPAGSGPDPQ